MSKQINSKNKLDNYELHTKYTIISDDTEYEPSTNVYMHKTNELAIIVHPNHYELIDFESIDGGNKIDAVLNMARDEAENRRDNLQDYMLNKEVKIRVTEY